MNDRNFTLFQLRYALIVIRLVVHVIGVGLGDSLGDMAFIYTETVIHSFKNSRKNSSRTEHVVEV